MSEERKKILEMLAGGKINVDEAERLLSALSEDTASYKVDTAGSVSKPKYLRVLVEPVSDKSKGDRVNVRVPLNLIRAGLKWAAFIPKHHQQRVGDALKEKGIEVDFQNIKPEDLEELVVNLNELEVEVDGDERVRVFCE
jgi:hypothetical protein